MKTKEIESILNKTFCIDCTQITLTSLGQDNEKIYSGPGVIYQTDDDKFNLKLFWKGEISISELNDIMNMKNFIPGKLIDDCQYYSISAEDISGQMWESEKILPHRSGKIGSNDYMVHGDFRQISYMNEIRQTKQNRLIIRFAGDINIPCNTGTILKKFVDNQEKAITVNRNTAKFQSCDLEFEITRNDKWLTVNVKSENFIEDTIISRINEALQFVLGRSLFWFIIEIVQNKNHKTIIRPTLDNSLKTRLRPPIAISPANKDTWKLFDNYLSYCIKFTKDTPHPISNSIHSVIEGCSASPEAEALTVSVAVESLLKTKYYKKYKKTNKNETDELETNICFAKKIINNSKLEQNFKNRIINFLNMMKNKRPIDILYELNKEQLIDEKLIENWKKLRNSFAHASEVNWSKFQDHINLCKSVTLLFYQLIFIAIGYTGEYTDYSTYGFPTKKFEHKRA